jgi:hypothetical protein
MSDGAKIVIGIAAAIAAVSVTRLICKTVIIHDAINNCDITDETEKGEYNEAE